MSELLKANLYNLQRLPEERILCTTNSNNPPTVSAGTVIYFGRNILESQIIGEDTDQVFAFNSGNFPAISDGIWYLWVDALGAYGATRSTLITIARNEVLGGWYSSDNTKRILLRFVVASSAVLPGSLCIMSTKLISEFYTTTTTAPSISGLNIIKDGGTWDVYANLNINGLTNTNTIKQYVNNDTTDANYTRQLGYLYALGTAAADSSIWRASATVTAYLHFSEQIRFMVQKYNAFGYGNNNGVSEESAAQAFTHGDASGTTRTNITQLSWAVSSGAFAAGSDIRIYKR